MSETIAQSQSENYSKSVGTSAVVLAKGGGTRQSGSGLITVGGSIDMPRYVTVHNNHGSQVLYLGWGSDVSTSNGLPVPAGEYRTLRVWYDDELWAIASGADTDTRVYVLHGKGDPPFSVLDLSPTLWVDASDASTITTDVGVSVWADKSGNGNDLAQATGADQPATGTRTINSLNVIDFDGTNHFMTTASEVRLSQPNHVFLAMRTDDISFGKYVFDSYPGAAYGGWFQIFGSQYYAYAGAGVLGGTTETSPILVHITYNVASSSIRVDGVEILTGNIGTEDLSLLTLCARDDEAVPFNGALGEIIIVNGTLSAQQISDTETYLADKWGITI